MFPFKVYNYDECPQSVVSLLTNEPLSTNAAQVAGYDISPDHYLLLIPTNGLPSTAVPSKSLVQGTVVNSEASSPQTPLIPPLSNPMSTENRNSNDCYLGTMIKPGANPEVHQISKDNATVNFNPVKVLTHCKMKTYSKNPDVNFNSMTEPDVDSHSKNDMMESTANCDLVNNNKTDSVNSKTISIVNCNDSKENSADYGCPLNIVIRDPVVSCGSMSTERRNPFVKINPNNIGTCPIHSKKKNIANLTSDVGFSLVNKTNGESGSDVNFNSINERDVNFDSINEPDGNFDSINESDVNFDSELHVNFDSELHVNFDSINEPDGNFDLINKPDTNPDVNSLSKNEVTKSTANCDPMNPLLNTIETNCNDSATKTLLNHDGLWKNSIDYGRPPVTIFKRNPVISCGSIGIKRRNPFAKFNRMNITEKNPIPSQNINSSNLTADVVNSTNREFDLNHHLKNTIIKNPVKNCVFINITKVNNDKCVAINTIEINLEVNKNPLSIVEEINSNPIDATDDSMAHCAAKITPHVDLLDNIDFASCSAEDKLCDTMNSFSSNSMHGVGDDTSVDCDSKNTANLNPIDNNCCDPKRSRYSTNSTKGNPTWVAEDIHRVDFESKNISDKNPIDNDELANIEQGSFHDLKANTDVNTIAHRNAMSISENAHNVNCNPKNTAKRHPIEVISFDEDKLCRTKKSENRSAIGSDSIHIAEDNYKVDSGVKKSTDKNPMEENDLINTKQENSSDSRNNTYKNPAVCCSMSILKDAQFVNCGPQNTVDRNLIDNSDKINTEGNSSYDAINGYLTVNSNPRYFVEGSPNGNCDHNYSAEYNPIDDKDLIHSAGGNSCDAKISAVKHLIKGNPGHIAEHNYNINCDSNNTVYNNDQMYTIEQIPCGNKNEFDMSPNEDSVPLKIGRNNKANCDDQESSIEISIVSKDLMSMDEENPYDTISTDNWNSIVNIISKNTVEKNPNNRNSQNVADKNSFISGKQMNTTEEDPNVNCDPKDDADMNYFIENKPMNTAEKNPNNCHSHNVADIYSFINKRPINSAEKNSNISSPPQFAANTYSFINCKQINTAEEEPKTNCDPQNNMDKKSFINCKHMNTAEENANCDSRNGANKKSFVKCKRINTTEDNPDTNCDFRNDSDKNPFTRCKLMNTAEEDPNANCDPRNDADKKYVLNCKWMNTTEDNPKINCVPQNTTDKNTFINCKLMNTVEKSKLNAEEYNPNINCGPQDATDKNYFMSCKQMNMAEGNPKINCNHQSDADKNSITSCKWINTAQEDTNINCDPQNDEDKNYFMSCKQMNMAEDNPKINCDPQNTADKNTFNCKPTNTAENKLNTAEDNLNINSEIMAERNCFMLSKPLYTAEEIPNCEPPNVADKNSFINGKPMNAAADNLNNCDSQNTVDRNLIVNNYPMSTLKDNLNIYCCPQNTKDRIIINSYSMNPVEENAALQNNANWNTIRSKHSTTSANEYLNVKSTSLNNTNINSEIHLNSSNSVALNKNNKCTPINNTLQSPDKCNPTNYSDTREGSSEFCFLEENATRVKTLEGEDLDFKNPDGQGPFLSPNIPTCPLETECAFNPLNQCVNVLPMASTNSILKEKYESMLGVEPSLSVNCASHFEGQKKHSLRFEPNLENLKLLKTKIENLKSGNFPRSNLISESPIATVNLLNTLKSKPNFSTKCENLSILKERYILLASKGKDIGRNATSEMDKNKTESFKTKTAHLKSIICSDRNSIYEKGISLRNKSTIQSERNNETKIKGLAILKEYFKSQLAAKSQLNYKGAAVNNIQGNKYFNMPPQLIQNLKAQRKQHIYAKWLSAFHAHKNKADQSLNKQTQPSCSYSEEKHRKLVIMAEQLNNSVLKRNTLIGASGHIQKDQGQIVNPGMTSTNRSLQLPSIPSFVFNERYREKGSNSDSPIIFVLNKPLPIGFQNSKPHSVPHNQKPEIHNAISKPEEFRNNSRLLSVRPKLAASKHPEISLNKTLTCNRSQTNIPLNGLNMQSQGNNLRKESNSHLDMNRTILVLNKQAPGSCNLTEKSKMVSILQNPNFKISDVATNAGKGPFKNSSEMHSSLQNSKVSTHSKINLNQHLNCNNTSINKPSEQMPIIPLNTFNQQFRKTYVEKKYNLEDIKIPPNNNLNEKSEHGQLNRKLGIYNVVPNPEKNETFKGSSLLLYSKASAKLNIEKNLSVNSDCTSTFKFSEQSPFIPLNALNLQLLQKSSGNTSDSHAKVIIPHKSAPPKQSLTERSKFISVQHNQNSRLGCVTFKTDANNKSHNSSSQSLEPYSKPSSHSYLKLNEKSNCNNASAKKPFEVELKEKSNCNNSSISKSHSEMELNWKIHCNNSSAKMSSHSEMELNKNVNCNNSSARKSNSDMVLEKKSHCNNSSKLPFPSEIQLNEKFNYSNLIEPRPHLISNAFNSPCTDKCLGTKSQSDSHIPKFNYQISSTPSNHILEKKFSLVTNEPKQNNEIARKTFKLLEPSKMQINDKGATLHNSIIQNFVNLDFEKDPKMQDLSNGSALASHDATKTFCKKVLYKNKFHNLKSCHESVVSELENNKIINEHSSPKPLRKSASSLHNSTQFSPNYFYKRKSIGNSPEMKHLVVQLQRLPPEVINFFSNVKNAEAVRPCNDKELPNVLQKQPEYICDMASNKDSRKMQCKRKLNMFEVADQPEKIQRIEKCSEDGFVSTACSPLLTDASNSVFCVDMNFSNFSRDENVSAGLDISNEAFLCSPNLLVTSVSEYVYDLNSHKEGRKKQYKRKRNVQEVPNLIENNKKIDESVECIEDGFADVGSTDSTLSAKDESPYAMILAEESTGAILSAEDESSMEPFLSNPTSVSKPLESHINKISRADIEENSEHCVITKDFSSVISKKLPAFISESISIESTFDSFSTRGKLRNLRDRITAYKTALKVVRDCRKNIWRIATTHKELRVRLFKLPYLPNKIKVPLPKLPDLIYEKYKKGKPIMLSNVMPLLQPVSDKNLPEVDNRSHEISTQNAVLHDDSTACQFLLPNKLKVDLFKLPDYIFEKHTKGKPIMLSNILPTISKVQSISVNKPVQMSNTVVKIERVDNESL